MNNFYRVITLCVFLSSFSQLCAAQAVNNVFVYKENLNKQTGEFVTSPDESRGIGSYSFGVSILGTDLGGIAAPTWSGPTNNLGAWYNGGVMQYCFGQWQNVGCYDYQWQSPTSADLNSHFGDGTYTVNVLSNSIPLVLSGDVYPNIPLLTLTGGVWSGSEYLVNPNQSITITTNAFSDYGSHAEDVIDLSISDLYYVSQFHSDVPNSNFLSFTIPGGTFQAGAGLAIHSGFYALVDINKSALQNSLNAAGYSQNTWTSIRYSDIAPVPLPASAWLLLSGLGGLGLLAKKRKGAK